MSNPELVLGVLASGRGSNLQAIFDALQAGALTAKVGVVISDRQDALALTRAKQYRVPALFLDPRAYPDRPAYDAAIVEALTAHRVELVILAGFMRLISKPILEAFPNKVINIHPSLLPSFTGLHAHRQALAYGVKVSGCTVHFVDEAVDHGPIIAQAAVPVLAEDTEESLSNRILAEEHRLLPQVIQHYAMGRLKIRGRHVLIEEGI